MAAASIWCRCPFFEHDNESDNDGDNDDDCDNDSVGWYWLPA